MLNSLTVQPLIMEAGPRGLVGIRGKSQVPSGSLTATLGIVSHVVDLEALVDLILLIAGNPQRVAGYMLQTTKRRQHRCNFVHSRQKNYVEKYTSYPAHRQPLAGFFLSSLRVI